MTVINEVDAQAANRATSAHTILTAVLDRAHLGDIHGALGSIAEDDHAPERRSLGSGPVRSLLRGDRATAPGERVTGDEHRRAGVDQPARHGGSRDRRSMIRFIEPDICDIGPSPMTCRSTQRLAPVS